MENHGLDIGLGRCLGENASGVSRLLIISICFLLSSRLLRSSHCWLYFILKLILYCLAIGH